MIFVHLPTPAASPAYPQRFKHERATRLLALQLQQELPELG